MQSVFDGRASLGVTLFYGRRSGSRSCIQSRVYVIYRVYPHCGRAHLSRGTVPAKLFPIAEVLSDVFPGPKLCSRQINLRRVGHSSRCFRSRNTKAYELPHCRRKAWPAPPSKVPSRPASSWQFVVLLFLRKQPFPVVGSIDKVFRPR